ncbi:MAG TPA: hypothetical protein VE441_09515, partial [Mycobacterium sp.]|nr:hypothetical protein [Mycobacterium sp.]
SNMSAIRAGWAVTAWALLAAAIGSPVAQATPAPQLAVSPTQGPPATQVTAVGTGFCPAPCSAVDVYFGGALVRSHVTVGAGGRFHATFSVPATALGGMNTVYATQRDRTGTDSQASTSFRITPSTPVGGSASKTASSAPTSPRVSRTMRPSAPHSSQRSHAPTTATTAPASPSSAPLPTGSATPAADSHRSGGFSPWWWLPIGLGLVGVLGVAGGLLARRRRVG